MALTHERRRLGGLVTTVLAFGIQAVALAFGPLALVQPLVATEVLFALPMIAHRNMRPLMRKENRRRARRRIRDGHLRRVLTADRRGESAGPYRVGAGRTARDYLP